jgi:Tfp pilus assembly protein PilO
MLRLIAPFILIGGAIVGFIALVSPVYDEITLLKAQVGAYNQALDNSKALENERDKLAKKYNSIDPANLDKLEKLLPDSVDNIRLILEIEKIASPYGMVLKEVKYDTLVKDSTEDNVVQAGAIGVNESARDYGLWNLSFSTEGTYANFLNFIRDLESNLRIVDISSIQFSSVDSALLGKGEAYKYSFTIKTYWLKN